jgi:hypothetical protein
LGPLWLYILLLLLRYIMDNFATPLAGNTDAKIEFKNKFLRLGICYA